MLKQRLPKECVYLAHACRRIWRWSKERKEAKLRPACQQCKKKFGKDQKREIDHIKPVGKIPRIINQGWDQYLGRMFVPLTALATLCHACHVLKSNVERRKNVRVY